MIFSQSLLVIIRLNNNLNVDWGIKTVFFYKEELNCYFTHSKNQCITLIFLKKLDWLVFHRGDRNISLWNEQWKDDFSKWSLR